jgi:hypothetical protein
MHSKQLTADPGKYSEAIAGINKSSFDSWHCPPSSPPLLLSNKTFSKYDRHKIVDDIPSPPVSPPVNMQSDLRGFNFCLPLDPHDGAC